MSILRVAIHFVVSYTPALIWRAQADGQGPRRGQHESVARLREVRGHGVRYSRRWCVPVAALCGSCSPSTREGVRRMQLISDVCVYEWLLRVMVHARAFYGNVCYCVSIVNPSLAFEKFAGTVSDTAADGAAQFGGPTSRRRCPLNKVCNRCQWPMRALLHTRASAKMVASSSRPRIPRLQVFKNNGVVAGCEEHIFGMSPRMCLRLDRQKA